MEKEDERFQYTGGGGGKGCSELNYFEQSIKAVTITITAFLKPWRSTCYILFAQGFFYSSKQVDIGNPLSLYITLSQSGEEVGEE